MVCVLLLEVKSIIVVSSGVLGGPCDYVVNGITRDMI